MRFFFSFRVSGLAMWRCQGFFIRNPRRHSKGERGIYIITYNLKRTLVLRNGAFSQELIKHFC